VLLSFFNLSSQHGYNNLHWSSNICWNFIHFFSLLQSSCALGYALPRSSVIVNSCFFFSPIHCTLVKAPKSGCRTPLIHCLSLEPHFSPLLVQQLWLAVKGPWRSIKLLVLVEDTRATYETIQLVCLGHINKWNSWNIGKHCTSILSPSALYLLIIINYRLVH